MARGRLTIALGNIAANYQTLRQKAPGAICAAVAKADAYGLGIAPVAQTLWQAGARHVFVAHVQEAIDLRAILPHATIYVLQGAAQGAEKDFLYHDLVPVINDDDQLLLWQTTARIAGKVLPAILHVDTGLNRMGFNAGDFARCVTNLDGLDIHFVMSHLACADEPDHMMNEQQRQRLLAAAHRLPGVPLSLAASDGIFCGPQFHFDMVRPGAALYGLNPTPHLQNPMQPVIHLSVPVLQIRIVEQDGFVGYSATQPVRKGQHLATVLLGYADGFFRSLSGLGYLYHGGRVLPVVGRVSMDFVTVDISALAENTLRPGDFLDVIGNMQSPEQLGHAAGTIDYEVMTQLGRRYERVYT